MATFLVGHVTKDGSVAGPARARAPGRLRAPVRGRPLPRAPRAAGDEEPLRLDERARHLRDDRRRPRRRARPVGALRPHRAGRGRAPRSRAPLEGTRPLLLEIQSLVSPTDLAMPRRVGDRRRSEAARDDRRRARPPRGPTARRCRCVRQRRRGCPDRRARRRPRDRARDRLGGPRRASPRGARRIRRDRPHRPAAAGNTGRPTRRGVPQARPRSVCSRLPGRRAHCSRPKRSDRRSRRALVEKSRLSRDFFENSL